jgi:hypothetical protein
MHTSVLTNLPQPVAGLVSRMASLLMIALCGCLALYPLLAKFVAPLLFGLFGISVVVVAVGLFKRNFFIKNTFLIKIWVLMLIVYVAWFFIAIFRGNSMTYITQDAAGFLLYLGAMPVIYLLIVQHRLQRAFFHFIEFLSLLIAVISLVIAVIVYMVLGGVSSESILAVNAFLARFGLSWVIDHNSGVLGLYTNVAHLIMLGIALALYRFSLRPRARDLLVVGLYLMVLLLDGRRALAITAFLQLLVASTILVRMLSPSQSLAMLICIVIIFIAGVLSNLEWLNQRFDFSFDDVSSFQRYAQIPALLDKIAEHPIIGGGFGSVAAYIRSEERPFSYEVDFLATIMKLGLVGSLLYFGTYLLGVAQALRIRYQLGVYLISAGLPFFFFMGTNGNQAMSTDSSIFHIFLFLMIAFTLPVRGAPHCHP